MLLTWTQPLAGLATGRRRSMHDGGACASALNRQLFLLVPYPPAAACAPPCPQAMLRGSLRKMFGPWDILFLGVGIVIGSGWAQVRTADCWLH